MARMTPPLSQVIANIATSAIQEQQQKAAADAARNSLSGFRNAYEQTAAQLQRQQRGAAEAWSGPMGLAERYRQSQEAAATSPQAREQQVRTSLVNSPSSDPMAQAAREAYTETPAEIQARAMHAASTEAGYGANLERNASHYTRLQRRSQDLTPVQNPSFI